MDSPYPYRIAWHAPPAVNVRSSSRAAILEALEYEFPTSRSRLAKRSGLNEATIRRACRQLTREEVMSLKYGKDPDTGISCDLVTFARYPVLPVLEITDAYMVWRLCDTRGESVFATVRDRGGFYTPEDDLAILVGQATTILRAGTCGLTEEVPMQPPVLLLSPRDQSFVRLVRRTLDCEPARVLTPEAATAHELRYHPATQDSTSVLYVRAGENFTASLLQRADLDNASSPFRPSPWTRGVEEVFRESGRDLCPHSTAWWKHIATTLAECLRYITPDTVLLESDTALPPKIGLRSVIPPDIRFFHWIYSLNSPSLAHRGALRLTRRALWDSMESEPPQAKAKKKKSPPRKTTRKE